MPVFFSFSAALFFSLSKSMGREDIQTRQDYNIRLFYSMWRGGGQEVTLTLLIWEGGGGGGGNIGGGYGSGWEQRRACRIWPYTTKNILLLLLTAPFLICLKTETLGTPPALNPVHSKSVNSCTFVKYPQNPYDAVTSCLKNWSISILPSWYHCLNGPTSTNNQS